MNQDLLKPSWRLRSDAQLLFWNGCNCSPVQPFLGQAQCSRFRRVNCALIHHLATHATCLMRPQQTADWIPVPVQVERLLTPNSLLAPNSLCSAGETPRCGSFCQPPRLPQLMNARHRRVHKAQVATWPHCNLPRVCLWWCLFPTRRAADWQPIWAVAAC